MLYNGCIKRTYFCILFYFVSLLIISHNSNSNALFTTPFKVSVRLLVYTKEEDIFWDLDKGTLHDQSVPTLVRNGPIQTHPGQTVRAVVDEAVSTFCKQLFDEGEVTVDNSYQIVAIFEDKQLNMQIQREMEAEPNSEYTAILLLANGRQSF